jgi:hypothetical protein
MPASNPNATSKLASLSCSIAAVFALSGCGRSSDFDAWAHTPAGELREIQFDVSGCYGPCPIFSLAVDADGHGRYSGQNYVAKKGEATFSASGESMSKFVKRLAEFRPRGEVTYDSSCDGPLSTDHPSVRIVWISEKRTDILNWYLGCKQPGLTEHQEQIYEAWKELPVGQLVGSDDPRPSSSSDAT